MRRRPPAALLGMALLMGCATTPAYSVRQAPVPEESASALEIERAISEVQAKEFEQQKARLIGPREQVSGFAVQDLIQRLSRVTERPGLWYRAYLYDDKDPNAAALADGRIYLSTGMMAYLQSRGSQDDELAFILGHELAHTVAQHLVKRYRALQQQQLIMALLAAGASAATRGGSEGLQRAGQLAVNVAGIVQDVHNSGYSQEQELEADQLGIRYTLNAGYNPEAVLALLDDFQRFDSGAPIFRTHPYTETRRAYLKQYLEDIGRLPRSSGPAPTAVTAPVQAAPDPPQAARRRQLQETQKLYPPGSVSWQNLQRQIDALE